MMASNMPSVCGICTHRQITTPAIIWCNDCEEGLCDDCRDHHSISRGTRTHDTITINDYQSLPRDVVSTRHRCETHEENFITFCRTHDCPCCKKCIILDHKKCDDVVDINDVIGNVKSSSLFEEVERQLEYFVDTLNIVFSEKSKNVDAIKKKRKLLEKEISILRKEIQNHLDKLHRNLLQALNNIEQTILKDLKQQVSNIETKMKESVKEKENLRRIRNHASDLQAFLFVKKLENKNASKSKFIDKIKAQNLKTTDIQLNLHPTLKHSFKSVTYFGNIVVKKLTTEMLVQPIVRAQSMVSLTVRPFEHVKLALDKVVHTKRNMITGCALLSNNRMAICCNSAWYCKVIFMNTDGEIDAETKVNNGFEYDIAYNDIDNSIIATRNLQGKAGLSIINEDNGIERLSIDIKRDSSVIVGGVTVHDDNVLCCTNEGVLRFGLCSGQEARIISDNSLGTNSYITTSGELIYFTNMVKTGAVTCCDFLGNTKWIFKNDILKHPSGIGVDNDGIVYVAGNQTDNVVIISPDGQKCKEILSKSNGLDKPRALFYDRKSNRILVVNTFDKKAFLFHVKK